MTTKAATPITAEDAHRAIELLCRYVCWLPPQAPGSTDGDTQEFLRGLGIDPDVVAAEMRAGIEGAF
jgi:hypothetical protein